MKISRHILTENFCVPFRKCLDCFLRFLLLYFLMYWYKPVSYTHACLKSTLSVQFINSQGTGGNSLRGRTKDKYEQDVGTF